MVFDIPDLTGRMVKLKINLNMKAKYFIGSFAMAVLGTVITLFVYTRYIEKDLPVFTQDSSSVEVQNARAMLTSFQMQAGQVDFTYAAEQTVHAVVHVHTRKMMGGYAQNPIMEWFYGDRYSTKPREVSGYGSGVIISADGYIITNNHVIEGADGVEVILNDKRTLQAKIVGTDPSTDIALLKVTSDNLPYIKYGDSEQLKLGEWVLAVGNPFNLTSTVTAGIVSAKGRRLGILEGDYMIESFIQTDAALNMGNSGGALVNTKGLLVGITSAILSPSGAYAGNSFAIPITIVRKVVEDLKEFGEVQRAIIGVNIRDVSSDDAEKYKLDRVRGIMITGIVANGSAEAAGLKANDIITAFDGVPVNTTAELQEQVGKRRPGDKSTVTYLRNGKESTVNVTMKNVAGNTNVVTADTGTDLVFGARLANLSSDDKNSFDVSYGVKVTELNEGKFRDLGIRKGYIILNVNGKKVNSPADVRQFTNNESTLKSIGGVQTDGTIFSYQFGN
ncbi:MAG TPA: deoxyribonuclease HsdR [Bacteroidales bacterium]|nr:deoxyribonuclease HsdR [Bacteroidales bacterium]